MTKTEQGLTIEIGDRRLTILERTMVEHYRTDRGFVVSARKQPHVVLVQEPGREYTLSIDVPAW